MAENRESIKLVERNVVLLPDERTRQQVIELNEKLQPLGVELTLPDLQECSDGQGVTVLHEGYSDAGQVLGAVW